MSAQIVVQERRAVLAERMVTDVKSKRPDIAPASGTDPLFGPLASELMRYLAAIAITAAATVVAVGIDTRLSIPNLSRSRRSGDRGGHCAWPRSVTRSAVLGALAFNFFLTEPRIPSPSMTPPTSGRSGCLSSVSS